MRYGQVAQAYDYGAVIWDLINERGFPAYVEQADLVGKLRFGDLVAFELNEEMTLIRALNRIHASQLPKGVDPLFDPPFDPSLE